MNTFWAHHEKAPEINRAIGDFIACRIWGEPREFAKSTTLGVFNSGVMVAGMVYYDYDRQAGVVQISGAADSPRWLTKPVLWEMFSYPFNELRCQCVVMRVDPGDIRLDRMLTSYGFEKMRLPRLRGRDKDEILYSLFDDVWKQNGFHKGEHRGQKSS